MGDGREGAAKEDRIECKGGSRGDLFTEALNGIENEEGLYDEEVVVAGFGNGKEVFLVRG